MINATSMIPRGWAMVELSDVVEILDSRRIPVNADERATRKGEIPYYGATGQVGWIDDYLFDEELILLGEDGAPFFEFGKSVAYIIRGKSWVNNHAHVLRAKTGVLNSYLMYQLNRVDYHGFVSGTTRSKLPQGPMRCIPILLPPTNEQRRIVEKIEELLTDLEAGVAALERVRRNLKRYRSSVLKAAVEGRLTAAWRAEHPDAEPADRLLERILVERRLRWVDDQLTKWRSRKEAAGWSAARIAEAEPAERKKVEAKYQPPAAPDTTNLPNLPPGWCWATVEQIAALVRNGLSKKPSVTPPGHRILRINSTRPMSVNMSEVRFYDRPDCEVTDYFLENGDLLFTRYNGSVDLLGVCGMVRDCDEPTLHPDKLIRVRLCGCPSLATYVEIAANVGESRRHMVSRTRTTAGQTGISGTDVREMPIPVPPVGEQDEIVSTVEDKLSIIEATEKAVGTQIKRAARLRQSILKRAFEGKLVPQDPNDEPADVLLDRIRVERQTQAASRLGSGRPKSKNRRQRDAK